MSFYDLEIWAPKKLLGSNALMAKNGYKGDGDHFVRAGEGWQITIDLSNDIEPEDIYDEVMQVLPDVACVLDIFVEGSPSEKVLHDTFQFCVALAKDLNGILYDPQIEKIIFRDGMEKISYEKISADRQADAEARKGTVKKVIYWGSVIVIYLIYKGIAAHYPDRQFAIVGLGLAYIILIVCGVIFDILPIRKSLKKT